MKYNLTEDSGSLYRCIGGGAGQRGLIIIENCSFDMTNDTREVTWHGANGNIPYSLSFNVSNCYFKNRFDFDITQETGNKVYLNFNNNSVKSLPSTGISDMILVQFNNEIRGNE